MFKIVDIYFQIQIAITRVYQLRDYHLRMEKIIESTRDWQVAGLKRRASELSVDQRDIFLEERYPYDWDISFPIELRASIIISGISLLESQLARMCQHVARSARIKFEEPKTNRLVKCRAFIAKHGLRGPSRSDWKIIDQIKEVRNILVHNGASLDGSGKDAKIDELHKLLPGIDADDTGYTIKAELCEIMLDTEERILKAYNKIITEKGLE